MRRDDHVFVRRANLGAAAAVVPVQPPAGQEEVMSAGDGRREGREWGGEGSREGRQ